MSKRLIIFVSIYFVVLLVLLYNQKGACDLVRADYERIVLDNITFSTTGWLDDYRPNLMKVNGIEKDHRYDGLSEARYVWAHWHPEDNYDDGSVSVLSDDTFKLPFIPEYESIPGYLIVSWLGKDAIIGDEWNGDNKVDEWEEWTSYLDNNTIAMAVIPNIIPRNLFDNVLSLPDFNKDVSCNFNVENVGNVGNVRCHRPYSFQDGSYQPGNILAVYPNAPIISNFKNEILFVDIHDGVPYNGDIVIEQLDAPLGTEPQIQTTSASGVTSLFIELDKHTDYKITAGSDVLNVSFEPDEKPFSVSLIDSNKIYLSSSSKPRVRITPSGKTRTLGSNSIIIDYYYDYAWKNRQIVDAQDIGELIELTPICKSNHADKNVKFIFARFSMIGFEKEEYTQTIPLICKPISEPSDISDLKVLSAIYQEYVIIAEIDKLKAERSNYKHGIYSNDDSVVDTVSKMFNTHRIQEKYEIFSVASVLKGFLNADPNFDMFSLKNIQLAKYLLNRLASIHHPRMVELTSSHEFGTQLLNDRIKPHKNKMYRFWLYITIWLGIGILVFGTVSRRMRIIRQKAWFDDASRGVEKGELPGSPLGLKLLLIALVFGAITSIYMLVPLLIGPG